jgi:hypothetical protein
MLRISRWLVVGAALLILTTIVWKAPPPLPPKQQSLFDPRPLRTERITGYVKPIPQQQ